MSSDGTKMVAWNNSVVDPIYTSTDSGVTWTARNQSLSWPTVSWTWNTGYAHSSLTSSADGTKLAAVVNGGGIYTSNDSGVTWTLQPAAGSRWWHSITSSADGTKLYAVSVRCTSNIGILDPGGVYASYDSGVTWTLLPRIYGWIWAPIDAVSYTHLTLPTKRIV